MTTVRLDIEYDGAGFRGWARQPELRTVQGVLEAALAQVLREEILLTVAGRTDTGVHALGQVASFDTEVPLPPDLARNLNGVTPHDVAVRRAEVVADGFNARFDARSRSYFYRVRHRAGGEPVRARPRAPLAARGRPRGARRLRRRPPRHPRLHRLHPDPDRPRPLRARRPRRVVEPSEGEILAFRITADAFMRNMVRALVGTMLAVASRRRTVENFEALLEGRPRTEGGRHRPTPRSVPRVGRLRVGDQPTATAG